MTEPIVALPLPWWAETLTAVLVVVGAAFAAIGSFGLVRLPSFFHRIHAPTLASTAGVWAITGAGVVYFSVQGFHLFLHAILIIFFIAVTVPVTTIFLMRAALFRDRQHGNPRVPPPSGQPGAPPNTRPGVAESTTQF